MTYKHGLPSITNLKGFQLSYAPGWYMLKLPATPHRKKNNQTTGFLMKEMHFPCHFTKASKKQAKLINPEWILASELYPLWT